MEELNQLVPVDSYYDSAYQLLIKLSYFDCGGISVGVCFSHRIGDAASFVAFMNAWAATCCRRLFGGGGTPQIIHPSFDLALYFPPVDPPPASGFIRGITKQKITTKRLVFEREKLEKLRKLDPRPSRVEAVSGFIWRSFIEAHKAKSSPPPPPSYAAVHVVNLRPRTVPPLPEQIIGNCYTFASAAATWEEDETDDVVVSKLRAAIRAVDDEHINQVLKDEGYFRAIEEAGDSYKPENILFTSWVKFPVYDVDFGWGKPVWVCPTTIPMLNLIILTSTPDEDGVEAWLNIDDSFFQNLQAYYDNYFTS